ncbi:MAG: hypothetical protein JOZ78_02525 [Chroococcidiopsidaceae cyanobacterium CP_BM_ER_R8_30]|nr:hypothetical protein [Chroococcidiopsidaceae cyanobacterium CP_BM_ER_R8_30]
MRFVRRIVGLASTAALITGMTGIRLSMVYPAQATMVKGSAISATPTTTNASNVPISVTKVGEYGENIYDAAKANNWTQASDSLTLLKGAAHQLDGESRINKDPNKDQLDAAVRALEKSVPAKDQIATLRQANQVTLLAANLAKPFNPPIPVQINLLDYFGRQLEIGVAAKNMNQLKLTAANLAGTWNTLRSNVESHGGSAIAEKFDNLVNRVQRANSFNEYGHLATSVLNQVDQLETVFKQ